MKKTILVYGLISGFVVSAIMLVLINYASHCEGSVAYNYSMLIGYASMLLAFSLVFVGTRNYRDKYNGGSISFGRAFKIGLLIVLLGSTVYVISWMIEYFFFMPDFAEKFSAQMLQDMKTSGASPAEIAAQTREMADFVRMYKNPFYNALMTYAEILPVGVIVALISSLILKRKIQPAVQ